MTLETFLDLAEKWDALGGIVQEQMRAVLNDSDTVYEQNPNALDIIKRDLVKALINSGDDELADDARALRDVIDGRTAEDYPGQRITGPDHDTRDQEGGAA